MSYLQDFKGRLENNDLADFTQLWEEYCTSDQVDTEEFAQILISIRESELAGTFGPYAETAIPLWKTIDEEESSFEILRLIMDIQSSNTQEMGDLAYDELKRRFGQHKYFNEKIRLVGLRSREDFQGSITNFKLLNHMDKGKFVFHQGGWGVGEIVDISLVREELVLEFDYVLGNKNMSFENAFKVLIPLSSGHFLSRRFGNPEELEEGAKADPLGILHLLLKDLGPKTAAEIKDEICELIIPETEWAKWWQSTRNKAKKDTKIEAPSSIKEPFRLRGEALSHSDRFQTALSKKQSIPALTLTAYNFVRDFPDVIKTEETKNLLREKLLQALSEEGLHLGHNYQLRLLLHDYFPDSLQAPIEEFIQEVPKEKVQELLQHIEIAAFKKRVLTLFNKHRDDWQNIFIELFLTLQQNSLRDYLLKELLTSGDKEAFISELERMKNNPTVFPYAFVWYFQKVLANKELPLSSTENIAEFFESFLILLGSIGDDMTHRELTKKMLQQLSNKRFELVRKILQNVNLEYTKEFILLVSKCRTLPPHDVKILHSLAEVVFPELKSESHDSRHAENEILWTTQEGYDKTLTKIEHLGTVEIVHNAREIEAARALGDLRENSEYKFALEKRGRLQTELKTVSAQLNKSRVITELDISNSEIGIGACVELLSDSGQSQEYTILGPWDADPDKHIVSSKSKLAQLLWGKKVGDEVSLPEGDFTIKSFSSFLQHAK